MSSLTVRTGIEYAARNNVQHQLLANLFEGFTFPDDITLNQTTRVLSKQGSDQFDHIVIPGILYFINIQSSAPFTLVITDPSNNFSTITANRIFTLVGSSIKTLTMSNPDPNNTVNVRFVYA